MGADLCQAWVHILCQAGAVSKPKATSGCFKDYLKPAKVGRNFPMMCSLNSQHEIYGKQSLSYMIVVVCLSC